MRLKLSSYFLFVVVFFVPVLVFAEHHPVPRLITVSGEAEVRVVPDEVVFTLGVETSNKALGRAKEENDKRINNVIKIAQKNSVEDKHIQTDYLSIQPSYDDYGKFSSSGGNAEIEGYFVRKTIVITLRDLSKFEALSSQMLEAGANYVHGIEFRTTKLRMHRDKARALAIHAAQEKANALANELGQSIGKPNSIKENRTWWGSGYNSGWGGRWSRGMSQNVVQNAQSVNNTESDSGVALGQIKVNATVTVSFELK
ncbi:MAG: SIMPL domain-containing protein [Gammaproteobacteria bacterium]